MAIQKEVGRLIRKARERRGISRGDLAEAVGVSEQSVGKMERGENAPLLSTLSKIAGALGVPPSALVPSDPPQTPDPTAARITARLGELAPADLARLEKIIDLTFPDR